MLKVEEFVVRAVMTNCYLVYCDVTRSGVIIDPGDSSKPLLERILELKLGIKLIINTHAHIDHIEGNEWFRKATRAQVMAHHYERPLYEEPRFNMSVLSRPRSLQKADLYVKGGEFINIGKSSLEVIHTPGHTAGSICLLGDGKLFTGDTLFAGSIGRTDFPGGSYEAMENSLKTKIMPLDDSLVVLPGHGPSSNLKEEKASNPYLCEL
ncbi:MAG: MBL fold metallo-hydrolase [Thermincolia bacterium]